MSQNKMVGKNKKWRRTNDVYGHERNFTHVCTSCGHDKFIFRHSSVRPKRSRTHGSQGPVNEMAYKCEMCSLMDRFEVIDTERYIEKIFKLRNGFSLYLPPKEVWMKESEEIKKRLETLGYI